MSPQEIAELFHALDRIATALETIASAVNPERMGGRKEHDAFLRVGTYTLGADPR